MSIILGIDPGSRLTGFGLVQIINGHSQYLASGTIKTNTEMLISERLQQIYQGVNDVIEAYRPTQAAIEQVFVCRNAASALKLGQARGAAMVAMANQSLAVSDYSAKQIKQAVVGYGGADKQQVQQMVKLLLNLSAVPKPDAADALAIALCHVHSEQSLVQIHGAQKSVHRRLRG
mgnify:CR=1 FL=1